MGVERTRKGGAVSRQGEGRRQFYSEERDIWEERVETVLSRRVAWVGVWEEEVFK